MITVIFLQGAGAGVLHHDPSDAYIRAKAKIYGHNPAKYITRYHEQINKASVQLALQDPNLLLCRQKLLQLARGKMNEGGYQFKKGRSRSKEYETASPIPKRPKTTETLRAKHIQELHEDVKDLSDQLRFKEKRRDQATSSRNCKVCDQLTEEMSVLRKWRRECEEELRLWKRKQQQADWYKQ